MLDFFLGLLSCVSFGLTARDLRGIYVEDDRQLWLYVRLTSFAMVTFALLFSAGTVESWGGARGRSGRHPCHLVDQKVVALTWRWPPTSRAF
jgi:hypothetical protein